jgi:AcrR family transcriptional regulator
MLDRRTVRGRSTGALGANRIDPAHRERLLLDGRREQFGFVRDAHEQGVVGVAGDECVRQAPHRRGRVDLSSVAISPVVPLVHLHVVNVRVGAMPGRSSSVDQTTRQRLLAVAERLFAQRGIGFVSVRDITTEARANTAAISYHFGSKDGLLEAIVVDRAAQLGRRRNELLDVIDATERPQLRDLVAALVVPIAELAADVDGGGRNWIRVKADLRGKPEMTAMLEAAFEPYTRRYLEVLERVTPGLAPDERVARFAVAKEAVELVFANDQLPGWIARKVDFRPDRLADIVIDFVTAGFGAAQSTRAMEPT